MITGGLASPNQIESNPKSAKLGTVRMVLVTARITVDRGSERAATIPSPSPITLVIAMHSADDLEVGDDLGADLVPVVGDVLKDAHFCEASVSITSGGVARCRGRRRAGSARGAGRRGRGARHGGEPLTADAVAGRLPGGGVTRERVERPAVVGDLGGGSPVEHDRHGGERSGDPARGGRRAGDGQRWPLREATAGARADGRILLGQEVVEREARASWSARSRGTWSRSRRCGRRRPGAVRGRRGECCWARRAPQAASTAPPARVKTIRRMVGTSAVVDAMNTRLALRRGAAALFSTHVPKHQDAPWRRASCR